MAIVEGATAKAVASVTSAGLLVAISKDPDFWVLVGSATLVSSASFYYDIKRAPLVGKYVIHTTELFKYILAGVVAMFVTFHALVYYVPDVWQLPVTSWYFISITMAGYGVPILTKIKESIGPVFELAWQKVFK